MNFELSSYYLSFLLSKAPKLTCPLCNKELQEITKIEVKENELQLTLKRDCKNSIITTMINNLYPDSLIKNKVNLTNNINLDEIFFGFDSIQQFVQSKLQNNLKLKDEYIKGIIDDEKENKLDKPKYIELITKEYCRNYNINLQICKYLCLIYQNYYTEHHTIYDNLVKLYPINEYYSYETCHFESKKRAYGLYYFFKYQFLIRNLTPTYSEALCSGYRELPKSNYYAKMFYHSSVWEPQTKPLRSFSFINICMKNNYIISIHKKKKIFIYDRDSSQNIIVIDTKEKILAAGDLSYNEFYSISNRGLTIWEFHNFCPFIKLKKKIPLNIDIINPVLEQINQHLCFISIGVQKFCVLNVDTSQIIHTYKTSFPCIHKIYNLLYNNYAVIFSNRISFCYIDKDKPKFTSVRRDYSFSCYSLEEEHTMTPGSLVQLNDGRVITNYYMYSIIILEPINFEILQKIEIPETDFYYQACPLFLLNDNTIFCTCLDTFDHFYIFDLFSFKELKTVPKKIKKSKFYWINNQINDEIYLINRNYKVLRVLKK